MRTAGQAEPRCALASFEAGRWTLYTQSQTPSATRQGLADAFKRKPEEFRIVVGDLGGGFGMKTGLANEDVVACYASWKLGRPVKWRAERGEDFLASHMGRDQNYDAELALDRDGRILALRMRMLANFGATPVGSTAIIPICSARRCRPPSITCPQWTITLRACSPTPWPPAPTAARAAPRAIS